MPCETKSNNLLIIVVILAVMYLLYRSNSEGFRRSHSMRFPRRRALLEKEHLMYY